MTHFVALHNQLHQQLRVDTTLVESLGAANNMVPVVLSEFLRLVVQYPIVFTKNSENGNFVCVALLGFEQGENLFWQDNQWQGIYTPLNITRQPFFIGQENGQTLICIDTDSATLHSGQGEAIFDAFGKETNYLNTIKARLAQLLDGETQTHAFIQHLLALNLLEPMALDIRFGNNQQQRVQGLYTINEQRLTQLDPTQLSELQREGYLQPIYTQLASLGQIYSLIQKKNIRLGHGTN
ncbi:SapC family protein [Cellvibrio sp. pealriver]|uniref:SapC family protein n=1 Tax=Cellvibrio sp. pealriver TaxID=1622269 RepID=UPI00066FF373|nr:SapC family protein [Cellvibrio sp. pealriver]